MSTNVLLFGILFFIAGVTIFLLIRIEIRLSRLFRGSKAESLEALMREVVSRVKEMSQTQGAHETSIVHIEERLKKQGRGIELLRFNPFPDVGGTQSFAVAIVNEEGDGVVFSSLYSRERMSVFAKPVSGGASDIELSEEERSVIAGARKKAQH